MQPEQFENIPAEKGTFILIYEMDESHRIEVGRLGEINFKPGYYLFVESARGGWHLQSTVRERCFLPEAPVQHIDHLRRIAAPVEVWYAPGPKRLEKDVAYILSQMQGVSAPLPAFAASEYHRTRTNSRLFYSKKHPGFKAFSQKIAEEYGPNLHFERMPIEM